MRFCYSDKITEDSSDKAIINEVSRLTGICRYVKRVNCHQYVGCGFDAYDEDEIPIEVKNDKASKKYGNIFLEYEQTFDDWKTKKPSGIAVSERQAKLVIIASYVSGKCALIAGSPEEWLKLKGAINCRILTTNPGCNGNRPGCYARGYCIPIMDIIKMLKKG